MSRDKRKALFLGSEVYSPKRVEFTYGSRVILDKADVTTGEVWFHLDKTNIKGYVVRTDLFVEDTKENRALIKEFKKLIAISKAADKAAWEALDKCKKYY